MRAGSGPNAFFAYGTLMRGRCRESCWPARPTRVAPGSVAGALYELGSYPGLVAGDGQVGGEVWWFADRDLAAVTAAIDAVEGHRGRANDEYRRERIEVRLANGFAQRAWTYRYRLPVVQRERIVPGRDGVARWTPKGDLDPLEQQAQRMGVVGPALRRSR